LIVSLSDLLILSPQILKIGNFFMSFVSCCRRASQPIHVKTTPKESVLALSAGIVCKVALPLLIAYVVGKNWIEGSRNADSAALVSNIDASGLGRSRIIGAFSALPDLAAKAIGEVCRSGLAAEEEYENFKRLLHASGSDRGGRMDALLLKACKDPQVFEDVLHQCLERIKSAPHLDAKKDAWYLVWFLGQQYPEHPKIIEIFQRGIPFLEENPE
jgi:hypothetical protein